MPKGYLGAEGSAEYVDGAREMLPPSYANGTKAGLNRSTELTSEGSGGADAELRAAVDWALESPLREEWNKDALTTFAGLWVFEGVAPRLSQLGSLVLNQRRFERIFFHFFLGRDVWFLGLGHLGLLRNLSIKCSSKLNVFMT